MTVKLRTGIKDGHNTAHKLMPRIASELGVGCMTVSNSTFQHGPSTRGDYQKHPSSLLTFVFLATHSVAWTHAAAKVSETRRLGLH